MQTKSPDTTHMLASKRDEIIDWKKKHILFHIVRTEITCNLNPTSGYANQPKATHIASTTNTKLDVYIVT